MDNFESAKKSFFEGLGLLEASNYQGAETQFAKALELIPDRVSTLNNLTTVKLRLNKLPEAEALARKTVVVAEKSPEAWSNLAIVLAATDRRPEALQAVDRALQCNSAYGDAWLIKSTILLELNRFDEALAACELALKLTPNKYEFLHAKSLALKELNRLEEAQATYQNALNQRVARSPFFPGERRTTQKAEVLILNRNPDNDASFRSFESMLRFCENYPGQLADHLQDQFHFTYVFAAGASNPEARRQIPQPDVVINNDVNAELILARGNLAVMNELVDSFEAPVVNHPTKAVQTTRDISVKLLEGIPGLVVPKTRRFNSAGKTSEEMVREIEQQYDYPLITRSLNMQNGKGMTKVDSREDLVKTLSIDFPESFFVTKFVDCRGGKPYYRKLRAAVVRDEMVIVRVDYGPDWIVHGRRKESVAAYYVANPHLLEEEKLICHDPEKHLGNPTLEALWAIRKRIPLDVFGIDFGVDADGKVIFYEANATMNLFSTAHKTAPNPKEAEDRFKEVLSRYLTSLAG